jgi:hypothetical protein
MTVLVAVGGDSLDEEPDQFAPLLESLRRICLDLRDALPERQEPFCRALSLFAGFPKTGSSSTEEISNLRLLTWFLISAI